MHRRRDQRVRLGLQSSPAGNKRVPRRASNLRLRRGEQCTRSALVRSGSACKRSWRSASAAATYSSTRATTSSCVASASNTLPQVIGRPSRPHRCLAPCRSTSNTSAWCLARASSHACRARASVSEPGHGTNRPLHHPRPDRVGVRSRVSSVITSGGTIAYPYHPVVSIHKTSPSRRSIGAHKRV